MKERKQEILTFVSYKRDHAAIWTFMEMMPNEPGCVPMSSLMQARDGQWYLTYRNVYNTNKGADHMLECAYFFDAENHVTYLN